MTAPPPTPPQAVAGQVFNVAVDVPSPGEYVADGAARQAAWALTGERPDWPVAIAAAPARDHRPVIAEQYARAVARCS